MTTRRLTWLLLLILPVSAIGCAHEASQGVGSAGAPLGIVDCDEAGDIYVSSPGPCSGFVYGDYEQYPNFVPIARSQVTRASDENRTPRVVTRPGFGLETSAVDNSSSSSGSYGTDVGSSSAPRMEPVPAGGGSVAPTVVSRPH